ncbi:MAG TPA: DUF4157 domain-containing protein [Leptolyngbyaceae cyanobacterium]
MSKCLRSANEARSLNQTLPSATPIRSGLLQRKCACGNSTSLTGKCSECEKKRLPLQRRPTDRAEGSPVAPIVHEVLNSPGQPLDPDTRIFMESRFGHDFSQVRVHTDAKAARSAQTIQALAYTVKPDIVFGLGQYAPQTIEGSRLLAHELVHIVQQTANSHANTPQPKEFFISNSSDNSERVADQVANEITQPKTTSYNLPLRLLQTGFSPYQIQRQPTGIENSNSLNETAESIDNEGMEIAGEELGKGDMDLSCHYRLGCPISVDCEGKRACGVASCGTGECRSSLCPPNFKNVIFKAWCQYDCLPSGAAFLFITRFGNVIVGPFCLD